MRTIICSLLALVLSTHQVLAEPQDVVTDFGLSPRLLVTVPLAEIVTAETLSLDDLLEKDRKPCLARIKELPKLTTLKFYGCNLSKVDEADPVPAKVSAVLISGGKISQGTIRWFAKFPAGVEVVFGCDVRHLTFELGKFNWITFDNCRMSRSAVVKLVEKATQVTFKEVELFDDK